MGAAAPFCKARAPKTTVVIQKETVYRTAYETQATETLTFSASATVVERSSNGTIIDNSTSTP
jgi:hypothetical protein